MFSKVHLTVPDPDTFVSEQRPEKAKATERLKLELVRGDSALRDRFAAMAQEAVDYGILDGL